LKSRYPYAVVNTIVTAIGGENSEQGAKRFVDEVLTHRPDVLFIDYALNDRGIGLDRALKSWEYMIGTALSNGIKVILCTPTPDQSVDILDDSSPLALHAAQIRKLAEKYAVGLVDLYLIFQERVRRGDALASNMSQINHPNAAGHILAAMEIVGWIVIDNEQ
jgi:lysophospholipase L1-like esterase